MLAEEELAKLEPERETVLTIGVFDGVHVGHQHLLEHLKSQAKMKDCLTGVVTFRCHPRAVLSPDTKLPYLTSLEERTRLLKEFGIDLIAILSFTPDLAQLGAHQFVILLQRYLKMRGLVIGPDFALGCGREGTASVLYALGKETGFTVEAVPPMMLEGEMVSSTAIRDTLSAGNMEKAEKLLGHPFSLGGRVARGAERGRILGFCTANLDLNARQALPPDGVYATRANIGNQTHQAVTNIGKRPTFGNEERTVEVYLLDFEGDLYGHKMRIEFLKRLRDEQHFDHVDELKLQISKDVEQARAILVR